MLEHLGDAGCSGETTVSSDTYVTADPINNTLYLGQIAGITLARMMGLGFHGMLLLGRLCNLALYLALVAAAVNIAPQRLRGILPVWHCWPSPCSWRAAFRRTPPCWGISSALLRSA